MFAGSIFGNMFETYEVALEVYIGNQLTNRQMMQAPKELLMANFVQMSKQISQDRRPMKVKMIRPEIIWDNFDKKERVLNNEIECRNAAMVSFEEDKGDEYVV